MSWTKWYGGSGVCWGLAGGGDQEPPLESNDQGICLQLDQATDFEERKLIRAALRELRQKKRGKEPVGLASI